MTTPDPLNQIVWLRHFTDTRNLPLIRQLGGLYSRGKLKEMGVEDVIYGGNQWSLEADEMFGMDQYVHLCFRVKIRGHQDKGSSLLLTFRDLARYYLPYVPSPAD